MDLHGKPMIWWVYSHISKATSVDEVIVATEDERIINACNSLGIPSMMTSDCHQTPTDRVWEVSEKIKADRYLFIGGDEPLISTKAINTITSYKSSNIVYGITNIRNAAEVIDFTNIKVVTNENGRMLYSTRSPIPYPRGDLLFTYQKTVGIALYPKEALDFFHKTKRSQLEKIEENDLIRFIEHNIEIDCVNLNIDSLSVDTPKDLDKVKLMIETLKTQE